MSRENAEPCNDDRNFEGYFRRNGMYPDGCNKPEEIEVKRPTRHYYIDWLRSSDVHVVVILHCIYTTDKVTGFSTVNHAWKEKMNSLFRFLVQIGIPLFFLLSGMGSVYFKSEVHGFCKFAKDKVKRLVTPFLLAVVMFLIPRLYLS